MEPGDIALVMCIYESWEDGFYGLRTVDTKTTILASEDEIYLPKIKSDAERFADYADERRRMNGRS